MGAAPASACECGFGSDPPWWDHERTTCAATIGPMPFRRGTGRERCEIGSISRASWRSSARSAVRRRALARMRDDRGALFAASCVGLIRDERSESSSRGS